jgi:hypothetical protein
VSRTKGLSRGGWMSIGAGIGLLASAVAVSSATIRRCGSSADRKEAIRLLAQDPEGDDSTQDEGYTASEIVQFRPFEAPRLEITETPTGTSPGESTGFALNLWLGP